MVALDGVSMVLSCSDDYYLVAHLYGVGDAEFSVHCLGELAGAFSDVSDVKFGRVSLPSFPFSKGGQGPHHADPAFVLSFL